MKGGAVIRQSEVMMPSFLYGGAEELADFGSRQSMLTLMVQQISASVGPGRALQITIPIM
jgi:hypothetical protein